MRTTRALEAREDEEKRLVMQKRAVLKAIQFLRFGNITKANERRTRDAKDERSEIDCAVLSANRKTA